MKTITCYFPELVYDAKPGHADVMLLVTLQNKLNRARWECDLVVVARLEAQLERRTQNDLFARCFPNDLTAQ